MNFNLYPAAAILTFSWIWQQPIISFGNGALDFQTAGRVVDPMTLLVARSVPFELHQAIDWSAMAAIWYGSRDLRGWRPHGVFVLQKRVRRLLRQRDLRVIGHAIRRFFNRELEGEWSSPGLGQALRLIGERVTSNVSMRPPRSLAA